jgi:hypothetical protein
LEKVSRITPELAKMAKSISKPNPFSKVDSNSGQALIRDFFPAEYSIQYYLTDTDFWPVAATDKVIY